MSKPEAESIEHDTCVEECKKNLLQTAQIMAKEFNRLESIMESDKVIPNFQACADIVIRYANTHPGFNESQIEKAVYAALDEAFGHTKHYWHLPSPSGKIMGIVSDYYRRLHLVRSTTEVFDAQMTAVQKKRN